MYSCTCTVSVVQNKKNGHGKYFFKTGNLFSERQNKKIKDTHTKIMHTHKINRRKD